MEILVLDPKKALAEHRERLLFDGCPNYGEAFDILSGSGPVPMGMDTEWYKKLCQSVIMDAIDRVEIARTGKAVFWP